MKNEQETMDIGQNLEANGWRQGSVIDDDALKMLLENCTPDFTVPHNMIAVLTTHSCDIANNKLEDGPFIEIMMGGCIDKINEHYAHNRNPRVLHATLNKRTGDISVSEDVFVEFKAYQTIKIQKGQFLNIQPSLQLFLVNQELRSFISWLAARFSRPAHPTSFNEKIQKVDSKKKQRKLAKTLETSITGLYVAIFPDEEISEDQNYDVNLLALVSPEHSGPLDSVESDVAELANIMKQAGMNIEYRVASESEISIATLRGFKRFYYDDLSIRANNNQLPPEVDLQL